MADDPLTEHLRSVFVGDLPGPRPVVLVDHDPTWADRFGEHEARIRAALGDRALLVEHIGSTSVPGLAAKDIVDIVLVVSDSNDEADYVPDLEGAGYALRIREPDDGHRMLRTPSGDVHLHVYPRGSAEVDRYLDFRDRLRTCAEDRALYERTKRALASREWPTVDHYADAKTEVVEAVLARAREPGRTRGTP